MLQIYGTGLVPLSVTKASQLLGALASTLGAAGIPANGTDALLVSVGSAGGAGYGTTGRRLAQAAIPDMYAVQQVLVVQVSAPLARWLVD